MHSFSTVSFVRIDASSVGQERIAYMYPIPCNTTDLHSANAMHSYKSSFHSTQQPHRMQFPIRSNYGRVCSSTSGTVREYSKSICAFVQNSQNLQYSMQRGGESADCPLYKPLYIHVHVQNGTFYIYTTYTLTRYRLARESARRLHIEITA